MPALCADPRCRGREPTHRCCWPAPGMPRCGRWSATPVPGPRRWPATSRPPIPLPAGDVVSEPAASPGVYRLRAVLHAVSPLIWRRLLVSGESTVADLHTIVQTAFGWGGEHLHRFVIHGAEYGINYVGGPGFRDARQVRLGGLGLRAVSYTHLRAHETVLDLVCRLL